MHSIGHIKLIYLLQFSKPSADRMVYRTIRRARVHTILELGMGGGQRAMRMIALASTHNEDQRVGYTGVDLFEAREGHDCPGLSLKTAFQRLRPTGARLKLVPGQPMAVLPQVANDLGQFDLVVISSDALSGQTPRAWFYLQRLLDATSVVLVEEPRADGQSGFRVLPRDEIEARALSGRVRKAA